MSGSETPAVLPPTYPTFSALRERLMVQCTMAQVSSAAAIADQTGSGLVLPGLNGLAWGNVMLKEGLFAQPILFDREMYKGNSRALATQPFSAKWIEDQLALQGWALTDSGYVAEGDSAGLTSILDRTRVLPPGVIATLPLSCWWLKATGGLKELLRSVAAAGVPVAIVVEHSGDPYGLKSVTSGLLDLLAVPTPVVLLRCDVSAVGALCFGAYAAAIGTTTALRHLYPVSNGGPRPTAKVAAVVGDALAYVAIEKIAFAVHAYPDERMWVCEDEGCHGRTLDWLVTLPSYEQRQTAAFEHSIHALLSLRESLLKPGSTPRDRQGSWKAHCDNAQFHHLAIQDWNPPPFLGAWLNAIAKRRSLERVN